MPEQPPTPPPLPASPFPDDLVAACSTAFLAATVRTGRARLEVHRTHLRIVTPVVWDVAAYARRMGVDDLVLSFDQIDRLRPVGTMTTIVELPERAAIALSGPSVRGALGHVHDRVPVEPRRFRPFFVNFWLIHHRPGHVRDARPMT